MYEYQYYRYTPATNYSGSDSFTFRVTDGLALSSIKTISITVDPTNATPVANDATIQVQEDTPYMGMLTATDAEMDLLSYTIVQSANNGLITITDATTGAFTYTPTANFHGTDTFTFSSTLMNWKICSFWLENLEMGFRYKMSGYMV